MTRSAEVRPVLALLLAFGALVLGACGNGGDGDGDAAAETAAKEGLSPRTRVPRFGTGPRYRPRLKAGQAAAGRAIGELRCDSGGPRFGVHLEVFANELDVVVPAGIGMARPLRREGAYVTAARCSYPVRTVEPTGLIEVERGRALTLGDFFDVWGEPLSGTGVLSFRARRGRTVSAFVDGRRWRGDPRSIPLRRHAAIVVEVGGFFPPTRKYLFPPGL